MHRENWRFCLLESAVEKDRLTGTFPAGRGGAGGLNAGGPAPDTGQVPALPPDPNHGLGRQGRGVLPKTGITFHGRLAKPTRWSAGLSHSSPDDIPRSNNLRTNGSR